jgi:nicotinate phosphoribosyltransferase
MSLPTRARAGAFSGLLTDFYELTMAAGYVQNCFDARATFELFVRKLPEHRNYLVAAGLEQALEFLENVRFSDAEISYLQCQPLFRHLRPEFFERLARFRFTGDAWALPEGTVFFPGEPLLRVTAPIIEAQLVETTLLATVHLQTLVASKAARITTIASGRPVIEFGSRRAHGIEAGVFAARAAFIGGCEGTSNTFAGFCFGIPVFGTQAHSWIMAHAEEETAFSKFLDVFPDGATLLVDTYDVHVAINRIIALGRKPYGVRLDSGDVLADSVWARRRLDSVGWTDVKIFVSGDLDENRIEALLRRGGCIDSFGVGTALSTSSDAPAIGIIYKLVEIEIGGDVRGTAKFSEEKKTYPGRKQVFRFAEVEGAFSGDIIGLEDESFPGSDPLLVPVMRQGRRVDATEQDLASMARTARQRFLEGRNCLPSQLLALGTAEPPYPVRYSTRLEALCERVRQTVSDMESAKSPVSADPTVAHNTVFWEVDLQADFMLPNGRLHVSGVEKIIPNIDRLVEPARRGCVFLVSSADAHCVDDPELREWPSHCMKDTPGADLIPEARALTRLVVPNQKRYAFLPDIGTHQQVLLQKNTLDVFDNPNTEVLLDFLSSKAEHGSVEFVVFGVATEYCVRCTVEGLLRRGRRVALVIDAIQSIKADRGQRVVDDLQLRGARLLTTDQALALVAAPLACPA